jgi:SAM-dependent methyltransferase
MTFHDHFSGHAADYARFRPRYPSSLFADLTALCPSRIQAWDCGTGNGQAAVALARHFDHVVATDASPQQIAAAEPHPKIAYRTAEACTSGLADASICLITVAQALHWFDTRKFFTEAHRVLRPGGVIAVWCYGLQTLGAPLDAVLNRFYSETIGADWPPERLLVEQGYRTLDFPFDELPPPVAQMEQRLSLDGLLNYLGTWSAVKRFEQRVGVSPIPQLEAELLPLGGDRTQPRPAVWPLSLRVGRKDARG